MTTNRYYAAREDGTVTGPHHPAVIRREIDHGTLTLDTQLLLEGTEDWMPAIEWGAEIVPPAPTPKIQPHAALTQPSGQKSNLRIVLACLCILIGLSKAAFGLRALAAEHLTTALIFLSFGLLWCVAGVDELLRQSRKK